MSQPAIVEPTRQWYRKNQRDLPWRQAGTTAWGVLVCEVMSQQTPVERVALIWAQWMQRWPNPSDLANSSPAEVIRAWDRLGYPRRALRLREAAIAIRDNHCDQVPDDYEQLLALPGIGDYTASAVLAFAYGKRAIVLDTNVRRVLARVIDGQEFPAQSAPTKAERMLADQLAPTHAKSAAHWAVACMELGAVVCKARGPQCSQCPLAIHCTWKAVGSPSATAPRAVQKFSGTDRQVRGKIMAVLRNAHEPVHSIDLRDCWPDQQQLDRCIGSLLVDGLITLVSDEKFALPA